MRSFSREKNGGHPWLRIWGFSTYVPFFQSVSARLESLTAGEMRAANRDSWQRQKEHMRTEPVRETRHKTVERVKDKRSRWLTKRRSRRVDRELAPVSNTCSPDRLCRSEAVQFTENQPVCAHTELLLFCTWWLRRVLTVVLSSLSHYRPGSSRHGCSVTTRARDRGCRREVRNRTFHNNVSEMTRTEGTVDALISSPRCERCSGLDNKVQCMTRLPGLLSGLIKQ